MELKLELLLIMIGLLSFVSQKTTLKGGGFNYEVQLNRYQYPRHFPTSLGTAVQILPEKAHCCNYGV